MPEEYLKHLFPFEWEHITFAGVPAAGISATGRPSARTVFVA